MKATKIVLACLLLAGLTVVILWKSKEPVNNVPAKPNPESDLKLGYIDTMMQSTRTEIVDKQEIVWASQGKFKTTWRLPDGVTVFIPIELPKNQPLIEFRLQTENNDEESPLSITGMQFNRVSGDTLVSGDISSGERLVGPAEVGKGFCTTVGDVSLEGRMFTYGKAYYVQYGVTGVPGNEKEVWYEDFFEIPEGLPEGSILIIYLTPKVVAGTFIRNKSLKEAIKGRFSTEIEKSHLEVVYVSPSGKQTRRNLDKNGDFHIGTQPLGGMLRIAESKNKGFALATIHEVTTENLKLPSDKGFYMSPEKLLTVNLVLPQNSDLDNLKAVGLKLKVGDPLPVSWNQSLENLHDTIPLQVVPGTYYVEAILNAKGKLKFETIGSLQVNEDSGGHNIKVTPKKE